MGTTGNVAVFVGSLRKGSFNRLTAKALAALAPAGLQLEIAEIGQLPLYNEDDDHGTPPPRGSRFANGSERPMQFCLLLRNLLVPAPDDLLLMQPAFPLVLRTRPVAA